jgi:hypothetical protein
MNTKIYDAKQQLPDGRWVPAIPLPYYKDSRPWYVRVGHVSLVVLSLPLIFWAHMSKNASKNRERMEKIDDWFDRLQDKWMIPVEPYTDEEGNNSSHE